MVPSGLSLYRVGALEAALFAEEDEESSLSGVASAMVAVEVVAALPAVVAAAVFGAVAREGRAGTLAWLMLDIDISGTFRKEVLRLG